MDDRGKLQFLDFGTSLIVPKFVIPCSILCYFEPWLLGDFLLQCIFHHVLGLCKLRIVVLVCIVLIG